MPKLKLTQYLYNEEEVKLSFMYSILTKQDISEVYYWLFEIYYSNEDDRADNPDQSESNDGSRSERSVFYLIWQVYYDYYYSLNPNFESYIRKKQSLWESNKSENVKNNKEDRPIEEEPIFYIIKNMHMLKHNCDLFMIRQIYSYTDLCQTQMIKLKRKGRPPSYLKNVDKEYHDLFYWILNKKWVNICYYLKRLMNCENIQSYTLYTNIINFCITQISIKRAHLKVNDSEKEKQFDDYIKEWEINKYSDSTHFILKSIYCFININHSLESIISSKRVYMCPIKEDMELTINHMTELNDVPTNKQGDVMTYKILLYKRSYPLYKEIGSFKLERFSMSHSEYKKLHHYNWEYYASASPIWKNRILKYNGKFCNESKRIIFENDSDLEEFYQIYGYDFDEQSLQVQELSLLEIEQLPVINWIYSLYGSNHQEEYLKSICLLDGFKNEDKEEIINIFKEIKGLSI